ncbi:MAG: hypothetical protein AB7O48_08965 [Cyclobacteriaceae bacterium]
MNWLVKTNEDLEVWSETEYRTRVMKCEYYGARPFWQKIRKLSPPISEDVLKYDVGEVIPYKPSSLGKRFAVIVKLFTEAGQNKFLGIDIENKRKVISSIV